MDFSVSKLALIALVGLIVIGPKDLPGAARMAGRMLGRLMAMRSRLLGELGRAGGPIGDARAAAMEALGGARATGWAGEWTSDRGLGGRVGLPLSGGPGTGCPERGPRASKKPQAKARSMRRVQRMRAPRGPSSFNARAKPGRFRG